MTEVFNVQTARTASRVETPKAFAGEVETSKINTNWYFRQDYQLMAFIQDLILFLVQSNAFLEMQLFIF